MIEIKSEAEHKLMAEAGAVVHKVLTAMYDEVKPGVSTMQLDEIAEKIIRSEGAEPGFKGYHGFPASICASINSEVVHGIPSKKRILEEGDIISIDVGSLLHGFYGDAARTYPVGKISDETQKLVDTCKIALEAGIAAAVVDNRISDISTAVQAVSEGAGYSVVREYVGHGIGRNLHEDPQVPNYVNGGLKNNPVIKAGMAFAIEPMINVGGFKTRVLDDKWTVVTADGELSAHFENTLFVTEDGPKVLT